MHTLNLDTPIGLLQLEASAAGLTALRFRGEHRAGGRAPSAAAGHLQAAAEQLAAYFAGERAPFDLALDLGGTPFQRAVWAATQAIPAGKTTSYAALAQALGRPRALRAVAAANGATPVPIVVPCHRVVGSDGRLTGYRGGLAAKAWLLRHEGALTPPAQLALA